MLKAGYQMLTPVKLIPGVFFDTRTILVSVAAMFLGFIPTIITMAIICTCRIILGGSGVLMGVLTTLSSGAIGLLWHKFRMRKIPLFVFVPLGHRLGGIWDSYICSLNSDLLPSCLKTVEKMFMGSAESNIDKNTNNERREFS
jgi:hypothetical protein